MGKFYTFREVFDPGERASEVRDGDVIHYGLYGGFAIVIGVRQLSPHGEVWVTVIHPDTGKAEEFIVYRSR